MARTDSQPVTTVRATLARAVGASLQSGNGLFEALASHTPVGIFISSAGGGCLYVNERWSELSGLNQEEAVGDGWARALHPDDAPRVNREWSEAAAHGRDSVVEYRFLRPDGSVSWVEGYAAALHDDNDRVIGWVGTCLDLTARKEAEEAVSRAAEQFRAAFDNAPIGMALLTPEGRWLQVNPALCELLGYTEDELHELSYAEVTHPDDREASIEIWNQRLAGAAAEPRHEKRYVRSDGATVSVAVSSTLVRNGAGEPLYTVAQIEDVTERRVAQKALEEAEERFRRAFDDAPIGMALVGLDGRWLRVNRTLCELTGYPEEALLARTFMDISHPDDLEENLGHVREVIAGHAAAMRIEKRYLHSDGRTVWVRVSSSMVRDADGVPLHFVSQIEDVTDRRRAEDELKDLADHDSLTGLLNRRRFDEELRLTILRLRRHGGHAALLLIDLDRFKLVNDTFGHKTGDDVLVAVSEALASRVRATDAVARFGGDEFAVLLHEADAAGARTVAEALAEALRAIEIPGEAKVEVTGSIGIVVLDRDAVGDDDALVAADRALYRAKHDGRDVIAAAG